MSTQTEVEVSYDVSNDFFRLWLDEKMNYTCALYEGTDSLEEAQNKKLEWLANAAKVAPGARVLDIGCGWGANLEYLSTHREIGQGVGITLSRSQHEDAEARTLKKVQASVTDYRDFAPA